MTARDSLLPSSLLTSRMLGGGHRPLPAAHRARPSYVLGDPGRPSEEPTLVIAVFDNSGSVIGPAGTDPLSNRFAEVEHAFAAVSRKAATHELGATLHFDTPTSGDVAPTPITRDGLVALRRGLHMPSDGAGSSSLTASLRRAVEIAQAHREHATTLVILSDFYLADPDDVYAELAKFPGQVHAVVLGGHTVAELANSRVTVTSVSRNDAPGAVARALFSSLIAHRRGGRVADA